ncbi:GT-D fold domain-containing glycosyltransferase [Paenibacillus sp. UMB7766-LJ446]|uniref:GT-D fold domain-containing protein n=1 Tax=Paenibacillus sp. UMB7766-LJ446 TaxID=3046313 RepID=UPI00254C72C8|nr:GT-D fold domain-containing glycosyltransferase [Paenibacillus sp. UMB7766-LJ446]MDK8192096.1 GT-D fold domain-containing glycosyltransferase [Paenibacillus sp. UMB7766-LJ446]
MSRKKTPGSHAGPWHVFVGVQPKAGSDHEWGNKGLKPRAGELAGIEHKLFGEPKGKAGGRKSARRRGSAGARARTGAKAGEARGSAGARAKTGERAGVSRGSKAARAKTGRRAAAGRGHAAPRSGRAAGARRKPRTAAQRAPRPAPQQATHRHGGVAPAGRESAAAHAGSARALAPAQPAAAPESGYAEGFRDGVFAGGEALVAQHIPPDHILPAVAAADLIEAGFRQYAPTLTRLASPHEMAGQIQRALDAQRPLSVVRLGDGELLTLAADTVLPGEQVQELAPFLPYAGVPRSTPDIRAELAEAIQGADWVGVPISRAPTFQGLLFPVFRHFGIDWSRLNLTSSTINYSLHQSGLLLPVIHGRRVLLIGSQAAELGALLNGRGVHVTGIIGAVEGVADIPRVMQQTAEHSFDIALVAAGIPAVILCRRIAGELGRVAIDFGHLADKLVIGELQL